MAKSYRRTRRSGTTNKDAVLMGIMGAGMGALNYKLQQWETERAEASEMRKAERLEAIQIAREGRQFEIKEKEDLRNFGQQKEVIGIEGKMRSDLTEKQLAAQRALNQEDNAARTSQIGMQIGANREEIGLREKSSLRLAEREAELRSKYPSGGVNGAWGNDGKWYPAGQPLPTGVSLTVGAGVSALARSGGSTLTPLSPRAKPLSPKPPEGWSVTPIADD